MLTGESGDQAVNCLCRLMENPPAFRVTAASKWTHTGSPLLQAAECFFQKLGVLD